MKLETFAETGPALTELLTKHMDLHGIVIEDIDTEKTIAELEKKIDRNTEMKELFAPEIAVVMEEVRKFLFVDTFRI